MFSYLFIGLILLAIVLSLLFYLIKTINRPYELPLDSERTTSTLWRKRNWWESKRGQFNTTLFYAAISVCLSTLLIWGPSFKQPRILLLEIVVIVSVYILYMGFANLFYNSGLILETINNPQEPELFREKLFETLKWIAVILPHLIPLSLLLKIL